MPTRRTILEALAAAAFASGMPGSRLAHASEPAPQSPLRLLILGGTGFLGPHTVRAAVKRGHDVTLFNRGRTNTQLFPDLEKLRGDRDGGLDPLRGRSWDAVIDTSGYVPRLVGDSARALAGTVGHYLFVSTISVYADLSKPGIDEHSPLARIADPETEEVTGETYGALKALSEEVANKTMPGRVTIVRPGLIAGPGDGTDRFTYWPVRLARGGEVLAPGDGATFVQYIDARDLADWIVSCMERRLFGTYNALSDPADLTMAGLLTQCMAAAGSDAKLTWVPASFLEQHGIAPWSDMPVWIPPTGEYAGFGLIRNEHARDSGLRFRSPESTARALLEWWGTLDDERRDGLRAGISASREKEVLAAWAAEAGRAGGERPVSGKQ